ncbi:MAG TPA: aspartate dehydrogenase [bacterium]|nr:aspartate dehydrogenase [bacterium]
MKKIGIVGCGNIGSHLAQFIDKELQGKAVVHAVCDVDETKAAALVDRIGSRPERMTLGGLVGCVDIVIEAANGETAYRAAQEVIGAKKTLLVMSSGGFIDREHLFGKAESAGAQLYFVSGAIAGLDAVKAAKAAGIDSVEIVTKKPPKGLAGAPYVTEKKIDLSALKGETVVFSGSAREAIKGFPQNVNVACTLSYAGIGLDLTKVTIVTAPGMTTNSHKIIVKGPSGEIRTETDNVPSPDNPKTSYLAVLSAMATLRNILSSVHVGS